jgi:hypothetical protein
MRPSPNISNNSLPKHQNSSPTHHFVAGSFFFSSARDRKQPNRRRFSVAGVSSASISFTLRQPTVPHKQSLVVVKKKKTVPCKQ